MRDRDEPFVRQLRPIRRQQRPIGARFGGERRRRIAKGRRVGLIVVRHPV
jgi:hypothetical protein